MSAIEASSFAKAGSFFVSSAWKRMFSRIMTSPSLSAAAFALASGPVTSFAMMTSLPRSFESSAATGASENFVTSPFAASSAFSVAAACSSAGIASIFFFSFLSSFTTSLKMLCGRPICEQRMTFAPWSARYLTVGSAPTMRFVSVISPSFIGTLKSQRTRTRLPETSMSSTVFLLR